MKSSTFRAERESGFGSGEPIVCTPEDSYRCFMRTEMDYLVLETYVLDKHEQPTFEDAADWRKQFALD